MALFNRKKGDASAPAAPTSPSGAAPQIPGDTFDFDAISRDLDAQDGASSFDSLLAAPAASTAPTTTSGSNSAFDFPENDPLGLIPPLAEPPAMSGFGRPATPASIPASIPEPLPSAPVGMAPLEAPPTFVPSAPVKVKKSLPLFPILGLLGLLAVGGGGAMFLMNSNKGGDEELDKPEPMLKSKKPKVAKPGAASLSPETAPKAPVAAPTLRSASPGIAPPPAPKIPVKAGESKIPIQVAQNPAAPPKAKLPSATEGMDPQMARKLKALWQAGADAKHKKDYAGARKAWGEALTLAPNHPGFQDSINHLPK